MGWIFAIVLFALGAFNDGSDAMLLASGLYAIAGAIAFAKK